MKSNFLISLGIWIAILPFLGIPGPWRSTLITLSGLFLSLVALGPLVLKKLQTKQKAVRKKKETPIAQDFGSEQVIDVKTQDKQGQDKKEINKEEIEE